MPNAVIQFRRWISIEVVGEAIIAVVKLRITARITETKLVPYTVGDVSVIREAIANTIIWVKIGLVLESPPPPE